MLPKKHRLSLRTELTRIQKEGRLYQGKLFSLLATYREETGVNPSRFAFIVSSKIHKKAVRRNRVRRLLADAVQGYLPRIRTGFDGVFLVKKAILNKELLEIEKEVEILFKKAKIL